MTPSQVIASLDRQLAAHGQDVVLRRRIGTTDTFYSLPVRALLRGYNPNQLVGNIKQTDSMFIISPTLFVPGWGGADLLPKITDFILDGARQRKIESTDAVVMNGVVVRIEGRILG